MIKLKKLIIKNFKGIKDLTVDFGNITTISADNAKGKTSIFDAFSWLLFGKDSSDRKDFSLQPLDENNNIIHHLDTVVTGILDIDGNTKELSRILKENWRKARGKAEQELKGTSTTYEVDGIPVKQKEYQEIINSIVDEKIFKMVTNPFNFNSLKWTEQRKILLDITGEPDQDRVINYNSKLSKLSSILGNDDVDTFSKKVKASISKLKEQVKDIPARIDENNSNIVEYNWSELDLKKSNIQAEINLIDEQISDASKANEGKLRLQDKLFELNNEYNSKISEAKANYNDPVIELNQKISDAKLIVSEKMNILKDLNSYGEILENEIKSLEHDIKSKSEEKEQYRLDYIAERDKQFEFDDSLTVCPCCGREYDLDKIEEIKNNAKVKFDKTKTSIINSILSKGKCLAAEISKCEEKLKLKKSELEEKVIQVGKANDEYVVSREKLENLNQQKMDLSNDVKEITFCGQKELLQQIKDVKTQIDNYKSNDNSELKNKKRNLQYQLEDINKQLSKKENNEAIKKRINELLEEEKDLNVKIADLEGQQWLAEEYIRTKVELLEGSINEKFKGKVTFKLFKEHLSGGLEECCTSLVNGVPFADANSAAKINAGLSIINTLCEYYVVNCPVFIDNCESINNIEPTDSQLIKLVVSKDNKLKVEVEE